MNLKTDEEIKIMLEGGKISKAVLEYGLSSCRVGMSTLELDKKIEEKMKEFNVEPWFNHVNDYKFVSCISVDDAWLHGMPNNVPLKLNDVIKIDTGIVYKGLHLDNCWTIVLNKEFIENPSKIDVRACFSHPNLDVTKFLEKSAEILFESIDACKEGNRIGDVSSILQYRSQEFGYNVIRGYGGHGIGKKHWEDPQVPCVGTKGAGPILKHGLVIAVELMNTMGKQHYFIDKDGWTVRSKDKAITSMFEHTVAITKLGPVVLTK